MAGDIVLFSQSTADRLLDGTKTAEGIKRQAPPRVSKPQEPSKPTDRIYIELIEEDAENPGRYSWKLKHVVNGALVDSSPLIDSQGAYTARDINEAKGLPQGTRQEVKFVGYDADDTTKPCYMFHNGKHGQYLIKVTGYISRAKYDVQVIDLATLTYDTTLTGSTPAAMTGQAALGLNLIEFLHPEFQLNTSNVPHLFWGVRCGRDEESGKDVYQFLGMQYGLCGA